ncbi:MAG: hypothetical protein ABIE03_01815 [Patescibacteria group bacterium]
MKTNEIEKNLKHGYFFLISIVLVLFAISLSVEIYLKGGFNFANSQDNKPVSEEDQVIDEHPEITLEFQNLTDGFRTKDLTITAVALTNKENKAWINGQQAEVNPEGIFERKIDLIIGQNEIMVEVETPEGTKKNKRIVVVREEEKKEEPKQEEKVEIPKIENPKPIVQPEPTPEPIPDPKPNPITGLKLHCSITNTQPFIGQTVSLDCSVKDQNGSPVNSASGSVTVNWQSGSATYNLPSSNSSGNTSVSFTVPAGNKGSISGNIRVTKDGLTVNSNFSIIVQ